MLWVPEGTVSHLLQTLHVWYEKSRAYSASHLSLWLHQNLFLGIIFWLASWLTLSNFVCGLFVFSLLFVFSFFLAFWGQSNKPSTFFFKIFFFNLLLNVLSMDSGGTYTQQLDTVPALGMYPTVRQYSHLQINRTSKKYSGCKGIMHKAHKKLKWQLLTISLSFGLDPKSLIFSLFFPVLHSQCGKGKMLLGCDSHTSSGSQLASPWSNCLKDSWYPEVFWKISRVLSTPSGAHLRKRHTLLLLLISHLDNYLSDKPVSAVLSLSQIHMLTLKCSQFLDFGQFQDFIWQFHFIPPSLLARSTVFSYAYAAHEKITLSSYLASTASVIK